MGYSLTAILEHLLDNFTASNWNIKIAIKGYDKSPQQKVDDKQLQTVNQVHVYVMSDEIMHVYCKL